jgi:hypothetical protein
MRYHGMANRPRLPANFTGFIRLTSAQLVQLARSPRIRKIMLDIMFNEDFHLFQIGKTEFIRNASSMGGHHMIRIHNGDTLVFGGLSVRLDSEDLNWTNEEKDVY